MPATPRALHRIALTPAHYHILRNETVSVARTIVTFLVPVGTRLGGLLTDLPDPGTVRSDLTGQAHGAPAQRSRRPSVLEADGHSWIEPLL
jgi:hypothetical protein